MIISRLPGAELVEQGIEDLANGTESIEALLVSMAEAPLRDSGFTLPRTIENADLRLYALLSAQHGDAAHGRYNSLRRRMVSFQRAAQCAK